MWTVFWRRAKSRESEKDRTGPAARVRLGELLLEHGFVTQVQLDAALERQAEHRIFLGEILVEMGAINRRTLTRILELQYTPAPPSEPVPKRSREPG